MRVSHFANTKLCIAHRMSNNLKGPLWSTCRTLASQTQTRAESERAKHEMAWPGLADVWLFVGQS